MCELLACVLYLTVEIMPLSTNIVVVANTELRSPLLSVTIEVHYTERQIIFMLLHIFTYMLIIYKQLYSIVFCH